MEYLEIADEIRERIDIMRILILRVRVMRDRANPFEFYSNEEFRRRFQFTKESVRDFLEIVRPTLEHHDNRGIGLPIHLQFLIALRFFAIGAFQIVIGDIAGVHGTTACRIVKKVSQAIALRRQQFIYFPQRARLRQIQRDFAALSRANFPGIIGAIDCSHIRIEYSNKPQAARFYNRKAFYSINVQIICDANINIINIVARWAGCTHDSRIFRNSTIKDVLESGRFNGHLVGDSGYPCSRYLLTLILREHNEPEMRYNIAHRRTRNIIERLFGCWKNRFSCLRNTLRTKIQTTQLIIIATAVLHNFAIHRQEEEFDDIPLEDDAVPPGLVQRDHPHGLRWRTQIIQNYST